MHNPTSPTSRSRAASLDRRPERPASPSITGILLASTLGPASSGVAGLVLAATLLTNACTNLHSHTVEENGRSVEVVTAGSGPATVVFEAGLGNDWSSWDAVASDLSSDARVFAYSRPGYGESDETTTPRDPATIVEELRTLLRHQGYAPPYLLVGHSFGGVYMELFARAHPDEVTGVVLVEPRHRDFLAECEAAHLDDCGIAPSVLASQPAVVIAEYDAYPRGAAEIAAAGPFGAYPVRVLTATEHGNSDAWESLWEATHASLAAEARGGRQVVFAGAGHGLQVERPSEVARCIRELLPARAASR